jgi:ribosomal protein L21
MVGTPTVDGIDVTVTVVDHFKGPKIDRFKYRPKKRIRVRGGHRQMYTRLMVDFIGKPGEERKVEKPAVEEKAAEAEVVVEAKPKAEKKATSSPKGKAEKPATAAKEAAPKSTAKKSTTTKSSAKKTDKK